IRCCTFTVDEVRDMLHGPKLVVRGEVETELVNTAHTNMLLLRQLFSQAEKFYLRLQTDISELENRWAEISKPKLMRNCYITLVFHQEISRLQEEKDQLKGRLLTMETLAMGALDEKTKAERALKDLQKVQGEQKMATRSQEITSLEDTDNLVSAKHDLLRVQEQLALAEKELDRKFQQTSAYRNMKEILTKRKKHIKDTRKRLSKYESDE
uniref:Leucine zipper transcription factor-like protein 1 n=1 Tax=Oncorhynchus tshawytscha TaxID=74940 RepID=A0A8C8D1X2_ONCTS